MVFLHRRIDVVSFDLDGHLGDSSLGVAAAQQAGTAAWAVPCGYNAGVPIARASPELGFDKLYDLASHERASRAASPTAPPLKPL